MNRLEELKNQINELKDRLNQLTEENGELSCTKVLQTSEKLDELINHYNKARNEAEANEK